MLRMRKCGQVPWHRPVHMDAGEGAYFVSAACYEHMPYIGASPERMTVFTEALLEMATECAKRIHAWCVLPNHYHLLLHVENLACIRNQLGALHGRSSFLWNGLEGTRGRKVWFDCSERAIRSDGHFWATMNYIHHNPVKHGYVKRWTAWPFSSAEAFLECVGCEEARRIWKEYPLREYGKGWDD